MLIAAAMNASVRVPTTAVILVAGEGTRLRPLTAERPKALMDVGGETILGRAVRLLSEVGVKKIVLGTGYREDAVRAAMANASVDVAFCPNPKYASTQNSVSLWHCAEAVGSTDFFKLDGDVVFRREALERLIACDAPLAVALDGRDGLGDEEMKVLTDGTRILRFGKDIDPSKAAGETMGIEIVRGSIGPALFTKIGDAVARGDTGKYYEAFYDVFVNEGVDVRAVPVTDLPWTEIDTMDDLERARGLVSSKRI